MKAKTKTTATKEEATPALVPKLRFPEFRRAADWEQTTLGAAARLKNGYAFKSAEYVDSGPFQIITIANVQQGALALEAAKRIAQPPADIQAHQKLRIGDILISMTGNVGRVCRVTCDSLLLNQRVGKLMPEEIDPEFFYHSLQRDEFRNAMQLKAAGGAQGNLSGGDITDYPLHRPAADAEQHKIAECLSSVDELIAAQARKVDALRTHKKGLMQQLFPREGETQPRLRFPEFQNAGEWVLTSVGGLVEAGSLYPPKDGNHGNIHPKSSDYVANGIPFIMASDLNDGLIDIETCHFISKEQADTLQKGFAKEGDVLLSHKGTVGEVAVVREINTPYLMLTPQVTYYRVKDRKKLSNEFLAQLFVSETFQSNLLEVSGGGTRAYIGITEQAKLRVQLPIVVAEQQRIADSLTTLDDLIAAQTQKLDALKTHKKGLMQQLFPSPEEVEG